MTIPMKSLGKDTLDEEAIKDKPKAVICLVDTSNDKKNVCNSKYFKKE
jgi:hypothetical protein